MGNKVSAEAGVNMPTGVNQTPPPECPMHNKSDKKTETKPSECPVQHNNDINPYNMVILNDIIYNFM